MYYRRNVVFRHTTLIFINMMEESLTKKDYTKIVLTYIFYGFVVGKKDGDVLHKGVKIALGIILGLALITVLLFISGYWEPIWDLMFNREGSSQIWINVLLIVIIAGAVISVVATKDKDDK